VNISPRQLTAIEQITSHRGRYVATYMPGPDPFPNVEASKLAVDRRGKPHLHVSLDRHHSLTAHAVAAANVLTRIGVIRVIAATGTRRPFVTGAGTYTNLHCLHGDERDALQALAALDEDDTGPALALAEQWASEIPALVTARPRRTQAWVTTRLAEHLTELEAIR
jgi:hypothetical protein